MCKFIDFYGKCGHYLYTEFSNAKCRKYPVCSAEYKQKKEDYDCNDCKTQN
ncbi:hypothetical protein FQN53_006105 [Emmonsiellopsis sp. PD_33]|nr:hypothetical protein FQN53_006105 [Emmonsiellopsis sp. PD_33]KAK2800867.1 hypothetical protein FQN51_005802 [Onygenales sp. PD_10]